MKKEHLNWKEAYVKSISLEEAKYTNVHNKIKGIRNLSRKDADMIANIDPAVLGSVVKALSPMFEDVNEKLSPKEMKKRLAMIKKAVQKINKQNADAAKKDALKMMKDSGMFDESVEIDEAPLVMGDMDILKTFFKEIEDRVQKLKIKKQDEKAWPIIQQLASMAGYGITKKGQTKGRTFRYDLKKK